MTQHLLIHDSSKSKSLHTNCTKLAWARSLSLSDQACLAEAKLPRLSERAARFTCEGSLRRAHLAWARSSFVQHNNTRLDGETSEHTCINPDFSLRRVPLA
ncbi:hypothetical protein DEO72_LG8g1735 [Vigna unguiculata]|uniref:Uncharacterized protein n=1 Tax=Vigna unguiculata TaxID=3917 RepID=A0A4D6MQ83_VIGUN|nr:hypothetical protein DEO72_LG8g1735 [Vigna unguiculata]